MITAESKTEIIQLFRELQTKEDLLCLLNKVKPLIYGDNSIPFQLNQLTWYYNPKSYSTRYKEFSIPKKSGKSRNIHAPVNGLKSIQKCLAFILELMFEYHESSFGFRTGASIVDNAQKHVASRYVYNVDLKDFFPSIDQARVWRCLQIKPFLIGEKDNFVNVGTLEDANIEIDNKPLCYIGDYDGLKFINGSWIIKNENEQDIKYQTSVSNINRNTGKIIFQKFSPAHLDNSENWFVNSEKEIVDTIKLIINHQKELASITSSKKIANIIAALCCTEMIVERKDNISGDWIMKTKSVLPQGAPTSPLITNIVCKKLDKRLTGLAKRFGLKYSRYADDITFSSGHNVYQKEGDFIKELQRIIQGQGFHIKESKTRLQKEGYRQEVTGLLVNQKPNIQKRYLKQLRTWIYLLEKHGMSRGAAIIKEQHKKDRGNVKSEHVDIVNLINGKLQYLKMVKGDTNAAYLNLKKRAEALMNNNMFKPVLPILLEKLAAIREGKKIKSNKDTTISYSKIVDQIIENGLDEAMKDFNI
jgi:hypothetical protein